MSMHWSKDRFPRLAIAGIALVMVIGMVEWRFPNASRLQRQNPGDSAMDFLPATIEWYVPEPPSWAGMMLAYPTLLGMAGVMGLGLLFVSMTSRRALARGEQALAAAEGAPTKSDKNTENREVARSRVQAIRRRRHEILEPILGGFVVTMTAWLVGTVIAGKLDLAWCRPFLPAPMLIAQNLQLFGARFFVGMLSTAWHMLQGLFWGTLLGLMFGFLLSHTRWLQRWTVWHVAVASALPPFLLLEVFKQLVGPDFVSIAFLTSEPPFKLGIAMATWAVMWPVLTSTVHALSNIDEEYRHSVRLLGAATYWERVRYIEFPVVLSPVLSNLRVGFVIGLIVLLYGEAYGSSPNYPSLGRWFSDITNNFKVQTLLALVVFTSLVVLAFEALTRAATYRFVLRRRADPVVASNPRFGGSVADAREGCLMRFESRRGEAFPTQPWTTVDWTERDGPLAIRLRGVKKSFGGKTAFEAGSGSEIAIGKGEFVSIIGKSGAGKTTMVKLLLGVEEPDEGAVAVLHVGGRDLVAAGARRTALQQLAGLVSYVTQRPTLLPHKTVEGNILFGLRQQWAHVGDATWSGYDRDGRDFLRRYMSWLVGEGKTPATWKWTDNSESTEWNSPLGLFVRFMALADRMNAYPWQLSGGEAQRVHLLRWIVLGRPILIMDEAFSALDQPLKAMLRDALVRHAKALGITVVNVSHDQADVLQVSDRILFVDDHTVVADADPRRLYYHPSTRELALFLGHRNLYEAFVDPADSRTLLITRDAYRGIEFDAPCPLRVLEEPAQHGRQVVFLPRSYVNLERLEEEKSGKQIAADEPNWFTVEAVRFTGTHYEFRVARNAGPGQTLRIDCVVQDDELERAVRGMSFHELRTSRVLRARVSVKAALPLQGTS